jgi:GT2 family glycosyltransferase
MNVAKRPPNAPVQNESRSLEAVGMIDVSFVVITKNEGANVERCLRSCWIAADNAGLKAELILADSNSQDNTVSLALPLASKIIRLPEANAPFAGRMVGAERAQGTLVQFVDGDMVLDPGWLAHAAPFLRDRPRVAAVAGFSENAVTNPNLRRMDRRARLREKNEVGNADLRVLWGGAVLVRAEALSQGGGFNPYLVGLEQLDVSWRLRRAGYGLQRLGAPMAIHHGYDQPLPLEVEIRKRWRTYFVGGGQLLRLYISKYPDLAPALLARETRGATMFLGGVVFVLAFLLIFIQNPLVAALLAAVLMAGLLLRGRISSVGDMSKSAVWVVLSMAGLCRGLLGAPRLETDYPREAIAILEGAFDPMSVRTRGT